MSDINEQISGLRYESMNRILDEKTVLSEPLLQFGQWMRDAVNGGVREPNAMVLSTATSSGKPSARVVLLRGVINDGFVFYTNYKSRKGKEISGNPSVSLTFYWSELERQVRIEGKLKKQSAKESDTYFNSRPRESQLGAWASVQSAVLKGRDELENRFEQLSRKFEGKPIPRPPHWGGYILLPARIEFWQGRANRLHDRILFTKVAKGWKIQRLSP